MPDLFGPDAVMVVGVLLATAMAMIFLTLSARVLLELRQNALATSHRQGIDGEDAHAGSGIVHAMAILSRKVVPLSA